MKQQVLHQNLAKELNLEVEAVVVGSDVNQILMKFLNMEYQKVVHLKNSDFANYSSSSGYTEAISNLCKRSLMHVMFDCWKYCSWK
ncbi:MAG: hypothetical protein MZV64_47415 [Ignavibacteriales bacterium]|nr:hypothetical protein [Ignavibacteriales bacterium]